MSAITPLSVTGAAPAPTTPAVPPAAPTTPAPAAVEWVAVADLAREAYPVPAAPVHVPTADRGHDPDGIVPLADRIRQTRMTPIHIDEGGRILDGRRRHAAAVVLGWDVVPALRFLGLTEDEKWQHAWAQADRRELARLTRREKEDLTRHALLRLHPFSDAYIAGLVPESERTVADRRAKLIEAGEIPEHPRLRGLDGRTYPVVTRAERAARQAAAAAEAAARRDGVERQLAEARAARDAWQAEEDARRAAEAERARLDAEAADRAARAELDGLLAGAGDPRPLVVAAWERLSPEDRRRLLDGPAAAALREPRPETGGGPGESDGAAPRAGGVGAEPAAPEEAKVRDERRGRKK